MKGLQVIGFDKSKIRTNKKAVKLSEMLKSEENNDTTIQMNDESAKSFNQIKSEEDISKLQPEKMESGLFKKIKLEDNKL